MDTQNYGLEKVTPALNMAILSMLNFWGVGIVPRPAQWCKKHSEFQESGVTIT